jgi:hypothetical protein
MFMRERSGETMILCPVFTIRSSLVTLCYFTLSNFNLKITKNLVTYFVYFGFVNLRDVGA